MRRVVIIGAGPAGSAAALALNSYSNIETLLLEKAILPRQKICGSCLSPWALALLDEMGVGSLIRKEAYFIHAALIGGSKGPAVELWSSYEAAILLRARLDMLLAHGAAYHGAQLREGVQVKELVREHGRLIGIQTNQGPIEADVAIVCSGAKTRLTYSERPGRILNTIMAWYEHVEGVSDAVELYFDPVIKPHYGWIFPESPDRVNIGICYDSEDRSLNALERFEVFLDRRVGKRLAHAERIGPLVGHPIATTHQPTTLVEPGTLVAGEAAKLVDPSSAEGIYHALASGNIAGHFLGKTLTEGHDASKEQLSPYTDLVRQKLGSRLRAGHTFLQVLKTPALDFALAISSIRPVRKFLTRVFAST